MTWLTISIGASTLTSFSPFDGDWSIFLTMAANTPPSKDSLFRQYKIRNAKLTGIQIGSGAYSIVEEAEIAGAKCVAKRINEQVFSPGDTPNVRRMNVAEGCRRLNNLHHPNVVRFLGVHFPEHDSKIPTLLMEALDTSLHQYLRPKSSRAKPSIPLSFKISILHGVACGLAYLHGQLPPLVHGHLSAKKVLLDSAMVAKISLDVGVTVLPRPLEPSPYMPPEVVGNKSLRVETTDVFSMGILTVLAITEELPDDILAPTYTDESTGLVARSELERRANYMEKIYGQLRRSHPLVQLIEKCLSNMPKSRPSMTETFPLFRQARVETPDPLREQTKAQVMDESASKSQEIVRIRCEFERHTLEMRDQIKGLLQGMAKLRKMLPREEDDDPREVVNEKEIAYIVTFLEGIRASDLGLALGIETHTLEAIALDNRHNEGKRRVAVLTEWVTNRDNPTWASLVDALSTIGQKRMADSISNDKGTR